jgi:hypothetical protein
MHFEETKGKFGFHLVDSEEDPHLPGPVVQLYVKSSAMSRAADLAISPRMLSNREIDSFVDEAISALQVIRNEAKAALEKATTR